MDAVLRPYQPSDAEAVVSFSTEAAALDEALEPLSLDQWLAFAGSSYNRGARDFVVAERESRIVGVLHSTLLEEGGETLRHVRVIVHPHHRGRGIGRALIETAEAQDGDRGVTLQTNCPASWAIGTQILQRRGFEAGFSDLWMHLDEEAWARAQAAPTPAGVAIRPDEGPSDDDAWARINDVGYAGGPHFSPLLPEDIAGFRTEPGFGLWFAERDGRPIGLCHVKDFGVLPCVNSLVVSPSAQGGGVGRALMHRALTEVAARGTWPIRLTVLADNEPARRIYETIGFRTVDTITNWRKRRPD